MEEENNIYDEGEEVDDKNYDTNSLLRQTSSTVTSSSIKAFAQPIIQESNNNNNNNYNDEFNVMMSQRKNETNDFRLAVITLGLALISIGILANLIFNLLIILRKKKRQTCTTLIMFSMSFSYLIYLTFYSLKLSIYFNGDNITKYHIYDTIDNWTYGHFLCKFLSALPFCVKLISRLSILTIILKRLLAFILFNQADIDDETSFSSATNSASSTSSYSDYLNSQDNEEVKFRDFFLIKKNNKFETTVANNNGNNLNDETTATTTTISHHIPKNSQKNKMIFCKMFEWPLIFLIIITIWLTSFACSYPIYTMYKLNRPTSSADTSMILNTNTICDSVYSFPEDTKLVARIYLTYLIYALILPCSIIFLLLIALTLFEISKKNKNYNSNVLIWLIFLIHVSTSLPQELYRYLQLRVDFDDETILDEYLTLILMQPLVKAIPYYSMQLIYTSEFALMPILFLLFYICSNCNRNAMRKRHNLNRNLNDDELNVNIIKKVTFWSKLQDLFYDIELSRPIYYKNNRCLTKNTISHKSSSTSKRLLNSSSTSTNTSYRLNTHYPHHKKRALQLQQQHKLQLNSQDNETIKASLNEALLQLANHQNMMPSLIHKPTPFELANNLANNNETNKSNVVHIIQHPSWRCNIKTTNTNSTLSESSVNNNISGCNDESVQLPFTYVKNPNHL